MSKRSADSGGPTPAGNSRQRTDAGPTPATAVRPGGRVILDVGGTRFVSSRTSLEGASEYFRSLLVRWDDASADDTLFIDADPDAFQVLLSFMRGGSLILPKSDVGLCSRALILAEYLGMHDLLGQVKHKAYANMRPEDAAGLDQNGAAAAFDEECGTLQQAIDCDLLPARFFAPAPPEHTVKALIPAPAGYVCKFTDGKFDYAKAMSLDAHETDGSGGEEADRYREMQVLSFALVEKRDGTQFVDAVVQKYLASTTSEEAIMPDEANPAHSHLHFASKYCSEAENDFRHFLIEPPPTTARMIPIAPGSVRGIWAVPALTSSDMGKMLSVQGRSIVVDGEVRHVSWEGTPPHIPVPQTIRSVLCWRSNFQPGVHVMGTHGGVECFELPCLSGPENRLELDLAFALPEGGIEDAHVHTRFFLPSPDNEANTPSLQDATKVSFGRKEFKGFCRRQHVGTGGVA